MMYRVEFNTTGFYSGQGTWDVLDATAEVEAETAQEAIEFCIDWMVENDIRYGEMDVDDIRAEIEEYAWRASEIITDEYGTSYDNWEYRD